MIVQIVSGIVFLAFVIAGTAYSLVTVLASHEATALRFAGTVLCITAWVASSVLFLFEPLLAVVLTVNSRYVYLIGNAGLFTGIASFSLLMNQPYYRQTTRSLATASGMLFVMLLTLDIADLVTPNSSYFVITLQSGDWWLYTHPLAEFLLITALFFTVLAVLSSLWRADYATGSRFILLAGLVALVLVLAGVIGGEIFLPAIPLNASLIITVPGVITLFSSLIYFSYTRPFFFIVKRPQYRLLVNLGYIGYVLSAFLDSGPQPLLVSPELEKQMKFSEKFFLNWSVGILTLSSVLNRSFGNTGILPVPASSGMTALTFIFDMRNPETTDQRFIGKTPVLLSIFVPTIMTRGMTDLSGALPAIQDQINQKETVFRLKDHGFLKELTITVLEKVLA
ncbi:MAG: hypothetical protein ACFFD4_18420 [Candidatus Odinarchaeota archaeon]